MDTSEESDGPGLVVKVLIGVVILAVGLVGLGMYIRESHREHPTYVALAQGEADGVVRGTVVDDGGRPVGGVKIGWLASMGQIGGLGLGGQVLQGGQHDTLSAEDGSFEFTGLPAGSGQLSVDWNGSETSLGPFEGGSGMVDLREGFAATEISVEVSAIPQDRILRGRFIDAAGEPVPRLHIKLSSEGGFLGGNYMSTRSTNREGEFEFIAHRAGGPVLLEWNLPDGSDKSIELDGLGQLNLVVDLGD